MSFHYDLFISYRSLDRAWATRLHADLKHLFPAVQIFFDQKAEVIPVGADYRPVLEQGIPRSAHAVVLWTKNAGTSTEVTSEVQSFLADSRYHPGGPSGPRTLFYVPLEDKYTPLEGKQGFVRLRELQTYDAAQPDQGISRLDSDPHKTEWERLVRTIGQTVTAARQTTRLIAGILTMTNGVRNPATGVQKIDDTLAATQIEGEPSLNELLAAAGLTLQALKDGTSSRYGETAFDWRPFGTAETIVDFLQQTAVEANSTLSGEQSEYQFHWEEIDLVEHALRPPADRPLPMLIREMMDSPSVLFIDPIALHHPIATLTLSLLRRYAERRHSLTITLSPSESKIAELSYRSARALTQAVLGEYFKPSIPPTTPVGHFGVNVNYRGEVERLLRGAIAAFDLNRRKTGDAAHLASMGTRS